MASRAGRWRAAEAGFGLGSHPLLDERRAEMDVELDEWRVADGRKAVNFARLDHENVTCARLEFGAIDDVACLALADELDLVIGVSVWLGATPRRPMEQERRDSHAALLGTDEIVGAAPMGQILLTDPIHASSF